MGMDVTHDVNSTTLGLYNFRIFVDCAWSAQKIAGSGGLALGLRRVESAGPANRKRPRANEIAKPEVARKKLRVSLVEKENIDTSEERIMTCRKAKIGQTHVIDITSSFLGSLTHTYYFSWLLQDCLLRFTTEKYLCNRLSKILTKKICFGQCLCR
jgi:hypothetical protein